MPKNTLGHTAIQDIRSALAGLKGALAMAEARRQAEHYGVAVQSIYALTKDLRPSRKPRADRGRARVGFDQAGMRRCFELVLEHNLDPDLAVEQARVEGFECSFTVSTLQRRLRASGLDRRSRRNKVRPCRRFEASAPGEIFQFDISGVKERWVDPRTRRILHVPTSEVSKNHPNRNPDRVPLWKFSLVDDFSRLKYVRFVACRHPTSLEVIDFLLNCFRTLGVPLKLYTDNGPEMVNRRMARAASILDRAFAASGGFRHETHLPNNAQATGKAEVTHKLVEKFEALISVKQRVPTLDELEKFCVWFCDRYNWRECRATGEKPMLRWQSKNTLVRVPPDSSLDAAFKAQDFTRVISADLTISFEGTTYQLPRTPTLHGQRNPFLDWIGRAVSFVWPPDADFFVLLGLDGNEYEITRVTARPDAAGEYKAPAESTGQRTAKDVKASSKARRAARREAGVEVPVLGFDTEIDTAGRPATFPKPKEETNPELLAALGAGIVPPSMTEGRPLTYFQAVEHFQRERLLSDPLSSADQKWLKLVFGARKTMLDTELRAEIEAHHNAAEKASFIEMQRRA